MERRGHGSGDPGSRDPWSTTGDQVPDGLPQLRSGAHACPEDGACLMEYVSLLAGTRFGDHPACTDPTLAALARLVNDSSSDTARPALALLAPALASAPSTGARGTAAVVLGAVDVACRAAGEPAPLVRLRRRAERRYARVSGGGDRSGPVRWLDALHRRGTARNRLGATVARLAALPGDRCDAALQATLAGAVDALRATAVPAVPVVAPGPDGRAVPSSP
jgi:hypothetical protein